MLAAAAVHRAASWQHLALDWISTIDGAKAPIDHNIHSPGAFPSKYGLELENKPLMTAIGDCPNLFITDPSLLTLCYPYQRICEPADKCENTCRSEFYAADALL